MTIEPGTCHALRFEPGVTRRAYREAGVAFVEVVRMVPDDRWEATGLGEWTVRELVGHAGRAFVTVSEYLRDGVGKSPELVHSLDYAAAYHATYADPAAIAERGRRAGRELVEDPITQVISWYEAAQAALEAQRDSAPVSTPIGVMTLADYLPCRILELVVHTDDLARALNQAAVIPLQARLIACCYAAGLAVESGNDQKLLRFMTGRGSLGADFTVL